MKNRINRAAMDYYMGIFCIIILILFLFLGGCVVPVDSSGHIDLTPQRWCQVSFSQEVPYGWRSTVDIVITGSSQVTGRAYGKLPTVNYGNVNWRIVAKRKIVVRPGVPEYLNTRIPPLDPGRYNVVVRIGGDAFKVPFTVNSGQEEELEIKIPIPQHFLVPIRGGRRYPPPWWR